MHKQFYPWSYMSELANPLEHALGWTTASVSASRKGVSVNISVCVCTWMYTHKHTWVCVILLFHKQTQFHFQPLCQSQTSIIRAKITSTMPASPHIAWPKKVRVDYSIDQQNHTYCPVFTGTVQTSCIGVGESLEQQNSLRTAHGQPKLA